MKAYLFVGGLVAVGFDATGQYLLTITHAGRGVFSTANWERIARDYTIYYPVKGFAEGIGPLADQSIPVTELDFQGGTMQLRSPDGKFTLACESCGISVEAK